MGVVLGPVGIGPSTGWAITAFSIVITSRGVETFPVDSPVGSWEAGRLSPRWRAWAFIAAVS